MRKKLRKIIIIILIVAFVGFGILKNCKKTGAVEGVSYNYDTINPITQSQISWNYNTCIKVYFEIYNGKILFNFQKLEKGQQVWIDVCSVEGIYTLTYYDEETDTDKQVNISELLWNDKSGVNMSLIYSFRSESGAAISYLTYDLYIEGPYNNSYISDNTGESDKVINGVDLDIETTQLNYITSYDSYEIRWQLVEPSVNQLNDLTENAYQQGYDAGYQFGLTSTTAYLDGYNNGYDVGFLNGSSISQSLLDKAYQDGFIEGLNATTEVAYNTGYKDAQNSLTAWINSIFNSINNFLALNIGGLTLGALILIPLSIELVAFIIRMFSGGQQG